jgi:uncharacterized membrane protein
LAKDYKQHYFKYNGLLNVPAVLILFATAAMSLRAGPSFFSIATLVLMVVTTITFAVVMKRPTMRGRKLLDEIKGFEDYLEIAEKYEMELRNPPAKTPQLFEKYLPFALALGVDQSWAEKFSTILKNAQLGDGSPYRPTWYNGAWDRFSVSSTTTAMTHSLSSAVTHSVTPRRRHPM